MHLLIFDLNLSSMSPLLLAATLSFMVVAVFPYEVQIPLTGSSSTTVVSSCPLSLITCLTVNSVPVKRTSDPDWNAYASTYNARLQYKPAVVVLPSTAQHVSDAVRCAAKDGVKVQAKSGGHSYASFSTGGQDGSMVILLENFQDVDVREDGVARVGAGTRLGNLDLAIYEQGKRALTHGLCKSVGVGGHFLHGGFGHWSRAWGLALDQIVGLDVVLANGSLVRASERTYPEVYYAMRGAGDSFGIATNLYLQTRPAPETAISWKFVFDGFLSNVSSAMVAMKHIQSFVQNVSVIDSKLGFSLFFNSTHPHLLDIHGAYLGPLAEFHENVVPELLRGLPPVVYSAVADLDWLGFLKEVMEDVDDGDLSVPLHGYSARENFYIKSVTTPKLFPEEALKSYFKYILDKGSRSLTLWFTNIDLYGGPGSQINAKDSTFAGYSHRDTFWGVWHNTWADKDVPFPDAGLLFLDGLNDALTNELEDWAAYINHVDPRLTRGEAHQLYYGQKLYLKLRKLKDELDPEDVFWNPHSI